MAKDIIVNVGERETRIAVLEDGKLVELHVERAERVVGSLYKCRVANVVPGMDASFVDIGLERNAFLYVGDVLPTGDDVSIVTTDRRASTATAALEADKRGDTRKPRYDRSRRDEKATGVPSRVPADLSPPTSPAPHDATENIPTAASLPEAGLDEDKSIAGLEEDTPTEAFASFLPSDTRRASDATTDGPAFETVADSQIETNDDPRTPMEQFLAMSTLLEANLAQEQATLLEAAAHVSEEDLAGDSSAEDLHEASQDEIVPLDDNEIEQDEEDEEEDEEDEEEVAEGSVNGRERAANNRPVRGVRRSFLRQQKIKDVIKVGQELLVQVIKGPRSTKGARVSTRISLPGRYLVLMPEADNLGVSRKIEDAKERDRLKKIGDRLRESGFGLIIRTEAEDKTEAELSADMDFLLKTWRQVQETAKIVRAPALVQQDLTLLYKTIRDVFGSDVNKLVIDDPAEYEKANELLERLSPKLKGRIHLYDGAQPIFDNFGLEAEMDRLLKRKVYLKSGGSLVIDETEALTVIDVNTSKFTGGSSLAETIIKTNLDAAAEIARQLRLRDIGGIIVIDFIDMNNARDKQAVIKALETVLKKDRSRTKISNISPLGLVEMTRKRTGETLTGFMTDECPYCKGRGHLPSAESVSIHLERELRRQVVTQQNARKDAFVITCHPEVAELLIGPEGATIEELERQLERALYVRADTDYHVEKYLIEGGEIGELEKNRLPFKRAQIIDCTVTHSLLKEPNKCIGWANGYLLDLDDGNRFVGQQVKARLLDVRRSYAEAVLIPSGSKP